MTAAERKVEWEVTYQTALGRMCESGYPTMTQFKQASDEANQHVEACEHQEWIEKQQEAK